MSFVYEQGNPPPQVVKMDIEGGEVMALPGMRRVLAEARPLMLMELHGPESSRAAWETLSAAGYQICWMRPGFPAILSLEATGLEGVHCGKTAPYPLRQVQDSHGNELNLVPIPHPCSGWGWCCPLPWCLLFSCRSPPRITGGTCGSGGTH